jgi:hypothetical protein
VPAAAARLCDAAVAAARDKKKEELNAETQNAQIKELGRTAMTLERWDGCAKADKFILQIWLNMARESE